MADNAVNGAQEQVPAKALGTRVDGDVHSRAQNAFWATRAIPEAAHLTWASWVEEAIRRYTDELEREHNGGQPFPERPGRLPSGRVPGM